jgi:NADH-ubiquinone oxidoreductase chain 5
MAATCGFFQNDMKKVIAYSTCSQLGYMMVSLGLSNYSLGIYHLMTHACFKALLFLSAGVVIHALSDIQDVRRHGGLMQSLPWVWNTMLLGSLSLTGWPFLSGFYSKDQILELTWSTQNPVGVIAYYTLTIVVCLTSFYTFRILYCSFVSSVSTYKYSLPHVGLSAFMWAPLLILSLGSILLGYVTVDMLLGMGTDSWGISINTHPANAELVGYHFIPRTVTLLPLFGTILGAVLAVIFAWPIPFVTTHPLIKNVYVFFRSKWQFDVVYNNYVAYKVLDWGADTWAAVDKGVLELLGPKGISYTIFNKLVPTSRLMSTGTVHDYAIVYISTILLGIYYLAFYFNPLPVSSFGILLLLLLTYI